MKKGLNFMSKHSVSKKETQAVNYGKKRSLAIRIVAVICAGLILISAFSMAMFM